MLLEFCQKTEEILPALLLIDVVLVEDGGLKVGQVLGSRNCFQMNAPTGSRP